LSSQIATGEKKKLEEKEEGQATKRLLWRRMPSMELQQMFSFEQMVLYRLRGDEWVDAGRGGVRLWGRPSPTEEKGSGVFRFVSVGTKRTLFEDRIDKNVGVYLDIERKVVVLVFDRRTLPTGASLKDITPEHLKTGTQEYEVLVIKSLQRSGKLPGEEEEETDENSGEKIENNQNYSPRELDEQDWSIGLKEQKEKEEEERKKKELIERLLADYPLGSPAASSNEDAKAEQQQNTDSELASCLVRITTTPPKKPKMTKEFSLRVAETIFAEFTKTSATELDHDPLGVLAPEDD